MKSIPLVIANYHGLDSDKDFPELEIYNSKMERIYINEKDDYSYEDLEPNTGVCLKAKLKVTACLELK